MIRIKAAVVESWRRAKETRLARHVIIEHYMVCGISEFFDHGRSRFFFFLSQCVKLVDNIGG